MRLAVLLMASALSGCVVVPYKPKAEVEQTSAAAVDPEAIIVTASARELLEDVGSAIRKADEEIKTADPQKFAAAAFLDEDASLKRLLQPESRARVREQLGIRYVVLVGEMQSQTSDEAGLMLAYLGFYGAAKSVEHSTIVATVVDLEHGHVLTGVESEAEGLSVGVGYFYGLFVAPMTDWSARDGLARGVVAAIRQSAGPGPLKIAVMAAEEQFVYRPSLTPEELLALEQSTKELTRQLAGQFPQSAIGEQGRERGLLIVDPASIDVLQLDLHLRSATETMRAGETPRAEIRRAWGEPWLTSDLWHVDIYRQGAPGVAELYGYVLVAYDALDVVTGCDAGIFLDAPVRIGPPEGYESKLVKRSIAAGSFELMRDVSARPVLTVDGTQVAQVLAASADPAGCLVVFGSTEQSDEHWTSLRRWSDLRLGSADSGFSGYTVDGRQVFEDSAWVVRVSEQSPGSHTLGVEQDARLRAVPGAFDCEAGEIVYVQATVRYAERPDASGEVDLAASFSVTQSMAEELESRPVVLTTGDDWLAPH